MHIIGASGHAKVIVDILSELELSVSGVWDDDLTIRSILNYPVLGSFDEFLKQSSSDVIIAIGNNTTRKTLVSRLEQSSSVTAIHPKSSVSHFATIGIGTVIMANAAVNAGAKIGVHVILNTNSSIDHDCIIGDFVHISPQAGLGGNVIVGEGTHIGLGASIIQGITIGKWATIGAGAVIIKDIPDYAVVVGNPGRIIKYNQI